MYMNMDVRHVQITFICFIVVTCQANFFYERTDLRTMLPRDDLGEHLVGNTIFCAVKCSLNSNCVAFWTNTNTSACRLITSILTSADMISSGSNDWHYYDYGPSNCPVEKGYISDVSVNICFKLFQLTFKVPNATQRCTEEGGHLLRITNLEQINVVKDYLESINLTGHNPTIDGFYNETSGNWEFSDGTIMDFFIWKQRQPKSNMNCLKLASNSDFQFSSARCSRIAYFICEVPAQQ